MRLAEFNYEYKTKLGKPIEFKIHEDLGSDNNRNKKDENIENWSR